MPEQIKWSVKQRGDNWQLESQIVAKIILADAGDTSKRELAQEMAKRWNTWPEMLEALEKIGHRIGLHMEHAKRGILSHAVVVDIFKETFCDIREAISNAKAVQK